MANCANCSEEFLPTYRNQTLCGVCFQDYSPRSKKNRQKYSFGKLDKISPNCFLSEMNGFASPLLDKSIAREGCVSKDKPPKPFGLMTIEEKNKAQRAAIAWKRYCQAKQKSNESKSNSLTGVHISNESIRPVEETIALRLMKPQQK